MPYSYEFTNPLSGVKIIATITDVWCVHIVAGHLRSGKHLEFYKNNYSDLYYSIVKCLNQEPYLLERNCQLPMITEDGLVLRLGNHNPSAFILGLLPLNPAKGSAAKQEVMAHPIPRHSKKLKGPAPIDDPPARRPVHPEDPYSQLYDLEPSLLFQSVERSRVKHAERISRRDNPLAESSRGPSRRSRLHSKPIFVDQSHLRDEDDHSMNVD
ncbi:hypothetical protein PC9H_009048 [Pleurotus ostreatus]|uniref:Uncharacterized protein n=1 Tax=Pleurotus ostreatus TaxID=5322 RepID=A0A8H6ZSG4_PLEOS|nr:uncharacterized protein PC9H_009048 [Pleurotus ostreatus]KAF7426679.1 hypothetical protein PC9H_009048 [Pleurotus ostreatus]